MKPKGIKYTIAGKELNLVLTVNALAEICDQYGSLDKMAEIADASLSSQIRVIPNVLAILANQGAALAGSEERITSEWIGLHTTPFNLTEMTTVFSNAINVGMQAEVDEPEGDKDEVLDEIRKNAQGAVVK